ncbi:hypothetical protein [Methylocella silvestris]|uniref:hypothetical protein n=1 Tax=Methylocella silvestris TaxID=199596 RepID=UPI00059B5696|nr:hypothetical protein [Methylocella silvestris]
MCALPAASADAMKKGQRLIVIATRDSAGAARAYSFSLDELTAAWAGTENSRNEPLQYNASRG